MNLSAKTPTAPPIADRDSILWRSYDDLGRQLLTEAELEPKSSVARELLRDARDAFNEAVSIAESVGADDARRGQSLEGLARARYLLLNELRLTDPGESLDAEPNAEEEPSDDTLYAIREVAREAVRVLSLQPAKRRAVAMLRADAEVLLAKLLTELCEGSAAEVSLQNAARTYALLGKSEEQVNADLLRGKLLQCRRQFDEAIVLFQQVIANGDSDQQFAGVLEVANTFFWTGRVREAFQQRPLWRVLRRQLNNRLAEELKKVDSPKRDTRQPNPLPHDLFRGDLIFAQIAMHFGDWQLAEQLLQSAAELDCRFDLPPLCEYVLCLLQAKLAVLRGQLECLPTGFAKQNFDKLDEPTPEAGCLDVLAIDACCQACLIAACTPIRVRKHCLFRRHCCRVRFVESTVLQPVDVGAILRAIKAGIAAEVLFQAGDWPLAATVAAEAATALATHIHADSPSQLGPRLLEARCLIARRCDEPTVRAALNEAKRLVEAVAGSRHGFEFIRRGILAERKMIEGEYDLAVLLYEQARRYGRLVFAPEHPDLLFAAGSRAFAAALACCPDDWPSDDDCRKPEQSVEPSPVQRFVPPVIDMISPPPPPSPPTCPDDRCRAAFQSALVRLHELYDQLSQQLGCDDYRLYEIRSMRVWLCAIADGLDIRHLRRFDDLAAAFCSRDQRRSENAETQVDGRQGSRFEDPRRARVLMGVLAIELRSGERTCPNFDEAAETGEEKFEDPFLPSEQLLRDNGGWSDMAICEEFLRIGAWLHCAQPDCNAAQCVACCFHAKAQYMKPEPQYLPAPQHHRLFHQGDRPSGGLLNRWRNRIRSRRGR